MTVVVLHLSDIHVRSSHDWILDKGPKIAACVFPMLSEASAVFIVISGDIAWSGEVGQYEAARGLFSQIKASLQAESDVPVHFVVAPGNHDCDFARNTTARKHVIAGARIEPSGIDDSVIETACAVQVDYHAFAETLHTPGETRVGDRLWTSHRFTVEGKEITFDSLNVSWCSSIHEDQGTLVFPHERYSNRLDEAVDLRICVLHHPLNWYSQAVYHPFRQFLRRLANVVISGHEHVGGAGEDLNADSGHSAYIEGCVLQDEKRPSDSSFNVAELNLTEGTYRTTRFLWTAAGYYSATEEGSWGDFRSLPKKNNSKFPIVEEFHQFMTDPGGAFRTMRGSPIRLADLYVYPDMQEPLEKTEAKRILSTTFLHDLSRLEGGVLLSGEEKVGATSLLFMLFSHYHDRGLCPLYIRGADLKGPGDKDLDAAIRKSTIEQYGEKALERFGQASRATKVLLLDDFDDGPVKAASQRAQLLVALAKRFQYFAVSVSELFEFKSSIAPHAPGQLTSIREYKLLQFGYTLRAHLVRKWVHRTSDDGTLDEGTLLAKCDQAERLLDAVMARNIVPALPLYLLTLLQSIDAGVSSGFEESGLGEYYDFLIKEGLKSAAVPRHQWSSVVEYCSQLAWQLHATEHKELSLAEMRAFTERFSKVEHSVSFEQRLDALIRARVLSQSGDYVRFRYHYIYYFLKGRYLSSKLDDLAVRAYVQECCAHLYVRENANTILFLAHHAFRNPVFLAAIVDSVVTPFREVTAIEFRASDTAPLAEFVNELPRLSYSGASPEAVREAENKRRDELDDGSDGLADRKLEDAADDFVAQMISLFKTVEILGQILKNQVPGLDRAKRIELLELLMRGPLRAIRAYFDLFMRDKEQAQLELAELLAKKKVVDNAEKRAEIARKLLAHLMQLTAFGFIAKAVVSISSDTLLDDIESASKAINTPAAKLIALGVRLDSPNGIPRAEVRKVQEEVKADFVGTRVLQMLTLRRLYMFRTTEQDRQWLASQALLDFKVQKAVEFKTRGKKVLKKS